MILLHKRLGHPSFHLLETMYPHYFKNISFDMIVCDACQLAKSRRKTYPSMNLKCNKPFQLIHCDIWGPSPHLDTNGFRWFLVCIDDHSWFCWLYLLKQKSETTRILKNLCQSIRRQFEVNVKGFRTNSAKDFCNSELQTFFVTEGI